MNISMGPAFSFRLNRGLNHFDNYMAPSYGLCPHPPHLSIGDDTNRKGIISDKMTKAIVPNKYPNSIKRYNNLDMDTP